MLQSIKNKIISILFFRFIIVIGAEICENLYGDIKFTVASAINDLVHN